VTYTQQILPPANDMRRLRGRVRVRAHVSLEDAVVLLAVARQQHRGADVARPLHLGRRRASPVVSLEDEAPVADVLFDCRDIDDGVPDPLNNGIEGAQPKPDEFLAAPRFQVKRTLSFHVLGHGALRRDDEVVNVHFLADHARHEGRRPRLRHRRGRRVEGQVLEQDDVRPRSHDEFNRFEERRALERRVAARDGLPLVCKVQFQPVLVRAAGLGPVERARRVGGLRVHAGVVPVPDDRPGRRGDVRLFGGVVRGLEPEPPVPAPAVPLDEGARQRRPGDEERPQPAGELEGILWFSWRGGLFSAAEHARPERLRFRVLRRRRRRVALAARRPGSVPPGWHDRMIPPAHDRTRREQRDDEAAHCCQSHLQHHGGQRAVIRMCKAARDAAPCKDMTMSVA
ncbi:unnamed protein product, partial [Pelagomonas calceolata]